MNCTLGEVKWLLEKIGHYFGLNYYLHRDPKQFPEQSTRDLCKCLCGKRKELAEYATAIKKLECPALELAVMNICFNSDRRGSFSRMLCLHMGRARRSPCIHFSLHQRILRKQNLLKSSIYKAESLHPSKRI